MLANYAAGCQCSKIEVINLFSWYNKCMRMKYVFPFCVFLCGFCFMGSVSAITKVQETAIVDHCDAIREDLKNVQRADARARVYIGGRYETILNKYVTPLNVWLVEQSLSKPNLIESQNQLSETKTKFANDYVDYQQGLEQLVAMDCKTQAPAFYDKLVRVRQKRKKVEQDVQKMSVLINDYKTRVAGLKETSDEKAE